MPQKFEESMSFPLLLDAVSGPYSNIMRMKKPSGRSDILHRQTCPICGSVHNHIHGYYHVEINCSSNEHIRDVLRIRKVRLKCKDCGKVSASIKEADGVFSML